MGHITSGFCGCIDCEGERGERGRRGKRGERGKRGHRGADGFDGATGSTGPTGSAAVGVAEVIAAGVINDDGTFPLGAAHPGFSAVNHAATGVYTLTLTNVPVNADNLIVNATLVGLTPGQISWRFLGGSTIEVSTYDAAGNPFDRNFTITAFDTSP